MCVGNRDPKPTNNYKVAVRMTLPSPQATSGEIKVEEYYLGQTIIYRSAWQVIICATKIFGSE